MAQQDTLVLVHGYLGYSSQLPWGGSLPDAVAYFRGVVPALRQAGHRVEVVSLPPNDSVAERAAELARQLGDAQRIPGERLHLIAHSMGGLDSLWALHHHADACERVRSVASLGTPFGGSPVADFLLGLGLTAATETPAPLTSALAGQLTGPLAQLHAMALLPLGAGLKDLATQRAREITASCRLGLNRRWISIAGRDARRQTDNTVFKAVAQLPVFGQQANDGLVPEASTHLAGAEQFPAWEADHAQLVGWTLWFNPLQALLGPHPGPSPEHLARYRVLAKELLR